jgi:hypothetical protein
MTGCCRQFNRAEFNRVDFNQTEFNRIENTASVVSAGHIVLEMRTIDTESFDTTV